VVELYWIPLGAGGHCVRHVGRVYEALRGSRRAVYHAALVVELDGERYAIELAPSPDDDGQARGVLATGAVGSRRLARLRLFRYEVRCWRDGTVPDLGYAVGGPCRLEADAQTVLDLVASVPTPTWGRDELHTGEMWNSNSMIAWVLKTAGLPADRLTPPHGGHAPGWRAGLTLAGNPRQGSVISADARAADVQQAGAMSATLALEAAGLTKVFGLEGIEVRALDGVDLRVEAGEMVAIMGPSGSGKSTLLHILGALDTPTDGTVAMAGERYDGLDDDALTRLRRDRIGFVFQFFNLLPSLTAEENVLLPALIARRNEANLRSRATELLDRVGLADRAQHTPAELSGGQQQRVSIARSLLLEPEVVLADEPTGNLDTRASREILKILRRMSTVDGLTVVMVTHDPNAAAVADRVVFLRDGKVAGEVPGGSTERVASFFTSLEPELEPIEA
jgi:putative ABC transport system ATP-binding protein